MIAESLGDLVRAQIEVVATEVAKNATSEEAFDQAMDDYLLHQKNLLLLTTAGIMTALGQDVDTAILVADNALTHNNLGLAKAIVELVKAGAKAAGQLGKGAIKEGVKKVGKEDGKKSLKSKGRYGKQKRLRELMKDDKVSTSDRGWLKQEVNEVAKGKKTYIRNPPGKDLAHKRGYEAAKGYDYSYTNLQDRTLHRMQHKYDLNGAKNKTPISNTIK